MKRAKEKETKFPVQEFKHTLEKYNKNYIKK
jgi:hypothetical protein